MARDGERWLGPGETAARLGVTIKALRVFEREGLVRPARTEGGWRAYGPAQIARLHVILVLRDLGLPLKAMARLLRDNPPSLAALLTVQQEALEAKRARIDHAIGLLRDARRAIASGRELRLDDLATLTKETVMPTESAKEDPVPKLDSYLERHLDRGTIDAMKGKASDFLQDSGRTKDDMLAELHIMIGEIRKAMAVGDPDAESARLAVRRWRGLTKGFARPDEPVVKGLMAAMGEALADPKVAATLPIDAESVAFMRRVSEGMKARGELH